LFESVSTVFLNIEGGVCRGHMVTDMMDPQANPDTCASWLRMRNRDGRYTLMFEEWVTEGDFIISLR
jgi:hypothetical protein